MGFIATILNFKDKILKVDSGGGNTTTVDNYVPCGDDSPPLLTDYVVIVPTFKKGVGVATGYIDLKKDGKSSQGDKRIYGRDESTGDMVNEIWLKNSGDIIIKNNNCEISLSSLGSVKINNSLGNFEMLINGNIDANGAVITPAGSLTVASITATSISIGGIDFSTHVHGGVTTGAGITGVAQ